MLQGAEKNYPEIEKLSLAIVTTARKLRPYFQSHAIVVLTNHPLRQIISKPDLAGRLVKWAIELSEFDVSYQPRNSIKAQVLADFIVEMEEELSIDIEACYEAWLLHVDGSSASQTGGAGVWLQGPNQTNFEYAIKLSFPVTNNESEYEALIAGICMAQKLKVESLIAYTDSQLVANQFGGAYEVHDLVLGKYLEKVRVRDLVKGFKEFKLHQVPRAENERADTLSKFANQVLGAKSGEITFLVTEQPVIGGFQEIYPIDSQPSWKDDIVEYLSTGALPDDRTEARRLEKRAVRYVLEQGDLYKKSFQGLLLKCLDPQEANYVMRKIHSGSCENHSGGRSLAQKVLRQGYFWPTLRQDAHDLVKKCRECQLYANISHRPATPMEPLKIAYPFDQWGIDILGPFPQARGQKKFIIVAVEYFTKWVEAEAMSKISETEIMNFLWRTLYVGLAYLECWFRTTEHSLMAKKWYHGVRS